MFNEIYRKIALVERALLLGVGTSLTYKKLQKEGRIAESLMVMAKRREELFQKGKMEKELKLFYKEKTGRRNPDFIHPKGFSEKCQWLKINDCTAIKTILADKYLSKKYINEKLGGDYAVPLLGVWDSFDEIDFDTLPEEFVLKSNHGNRNNFFVYKGISPLLQKRYHLAHIPFALGKENIDKKKMKECFESWLKINYGFALLYEFNYARIERKIIAEKLLKRPIEYKFLCINGHVEYVYNFIRVSYDKSYTITCSLYSENWEKLDFNDDKDSEENPQAVEKPEHFDEMLEMARKLSAGISLLRVDFYVCENRVYVGELTTMPFSGTANFTDPFKEEEIGERMILPRKTALKY